VSALDAPGVLEGLTAAWPKLGRSERVQLAAAHPVFWAMLCSEGRWLPARHLLYISRKLMRLVSGESRRLMISTPPRHGKTAFVWRYFGGWWLGHRPRSKVMGVTYQARQACRWSKQARDDLSAFGPEVFGVGASPRAAAEEWNVLRAGQPTGGLMNALGMGGALTGKGGDLLACDDLVSGVAATRNPAIREQAMEWAEQDLLSRFEDPSSSAVIIGTRWHEDDIIGRILAAQAEGAPPGGYDWEVVNLPLLAEEDDELGRKPGEALWPEKWTQEWAEAKQRTTAPHSFSALYQGRPTPKSGGMFQRDEVRSFEEQGGDLVFAGGRVPKGGLVKGLFVDPAFSLKKSADFTAMAAVGADPRTGRVFVLDMLRKRLTPAEVGPAMRDLMAKHGIARAFMERSGFKSDETKLIHKSFGLPIMEIQPNTDKVERAMPLSDYMATEKVFFPARAVWLPVLLHELLAFPNSEKDDQVDVLSQAVFVFMQMIVVVEPKKPAERPPEPERDERFGNGMRRARDRDGGGGRWIKRRDR
jgi:predicted phage terminase large subunit-like protein